MSLAIKAGLKHIMSLIAVRIPFLAAGPVGWVVSFIIGKLLTLIIENGVLGINLLVIDFSTRRDADNMEEALREASEVDQKDPVAVEQANEKIKDAMRDLIRLGRAPL